MRAAHLATAVRRMSRPAPDGLVTRRSRVRFPSRALRLMPGSAAIPRATCHPDFPSGTGRLRASIARPRRQESGAHRLGSRLTELGHWLQRIKRRRQNRRPACGAPPIPRHAAITMISRSRRSAHRSSVRPPLATIPVLLELAAPAIARSPHCGRRASTPPRRSAMSDMWSDVPPSNGVVP